MSAQSWEKGKHCKKSKHSWRSAEWTEKLSRTSSASSTEQLHRNRRFHRTRRPSRFKSNSTHWKKRWWSWALCKRKRSTCPVGNNPDAKLAQIKESRAQALKELSDGFNVCEAGRRNACTGWDTVGWFREWTTRSTGCSCVRSTSTRWCASAAAQHCSHQSHEKVAPTQTRPRTWTGLRWVSS